MHIQTFADGNLKWRLYGWEWRHMQHNTVHAYLIKKSRIKTSQLMQSHALRTRRAGDKHNEEAFSKIETAKGMLRSRLG